LTILCSSACSSISSQTQPQNVHVAFFTMFNSAINPRQSRSKGLRYIRYMRIGAQESILR
jgi:hypothetical protein